MAETRLKVDRQPDVTIASFKDSSILDVVTIQQIGKELNDVVSGLGKGKLILDFTDVRFLSSQALGTFVALQRQADAAGAKIVLCSIRPEIVRILKITNLDKVFRFFGGRDEALAYLGVRARIDRAAVFATCR